MLNLIYKTSEQKITETDIYKENEQVIARGEGAWKMNEIGERS